MTDIEQDSSNWFEFNVSGLGFEVGGRASPELYKTISEYLVAIADREPAKGDESSRVFHPSYSTIVELSSDEQITLVTYSNLEQFQQSSEKWHKSPRTFERLHNSMARAKSQPTMPSEFPRILRVIDRNGKEYKGFHVEGFISAVKNGWLWDVSNLGEKSVHFAQDFTKELEMN